MVEYLSLFGSVAGSAVSLASQQVAFASIPLTLALSLNLVNRQRSEQHTRAAITQVAKQLSNDVLAIRSLVHSLPPPPEPTDLSGVEGQIQGNLKAIAQLRQHFNELPLPPRPYNPAPLSAELSILRQELLGLAASSQGKIAAVQAKLETLTTGSDETVGRQVNEINEQLKKLQPSYEYKLVIDRVGSREVLEKALDETQNRLIIVCPWLSKYSIDRQLINKLTALLHLHQGVLIDIGWGNLRDFNNGGLGRGRNYNALDDLRQLERQYPNRLRLKLLGTHEKFLVCDHTFAMLGSHNVLTSGTSSAEREVGLYSTDQRIIQDLTARFDNAVAISEWSRQLDTAGVA